jgi:subtilisin family serine protease
VVRFSVGTMVQGFDHARRHGAHVLSMSMGGISSRALVDAVNLAYDAGMVMVTAAGNNFAGWPMPRTIVFPARYRCLLRVMADGRALTSGTMQGSHGPPSKMATALAPYAQRPVGANGWRSSTWTARQRSPTRRCRRGRAVAGRALRRVSRYPEPWMRVEAVRRALRHRRGRCRMTARSFETIGQASPGRVRSPAPPLHGTPTLPARRWWLDMFTGGGVSLCARGTLAVAGRDVGPS